MLLFYMLPRFEVPVVGLTLGGLFGLAALRDRHKPEVFQRTAR